ncbi:mucosal addressin cell adhesion molecule 1 isoform X2 [Heliangelus exortis]|uniref:mucosal addressin cell adhesion molecule 1 isoform X2 n=1 Tax=Heliangelus exortis TaxID=472823 RepID=UPI003A8EAF71
MGAVYRRLPLLGLLWTIRINCLTLRTERMWDTPSARSCLSREFPDGKGTGPVCLSFPPSARAMALAPLLLLLLLLGLLQSCRGQPMLVVTPQEPVVRFGGSVQLNCSLGCEGGTVEWKGLDTNLGNVTSFLTHSILHIDSAVVATAGTKICQGTCRGQRYQHSVTLQLYALPDRLQLEAEPGVPVPGQPTRLHCRARGVYPLGGLRLSWQRGHGEPQEAADFKVTETEEELFDIESTLLVAGEEVRDGMEFRCEMTLSTRKETFTRVASVAVSVGAMMEQPGAAATWTARPLTGTLSTAVSPEPRVPTDSPTAALTPTLPDPGTETPLKQAASPKGPSTAHPTLWDLISQPGTTTLPGSTGPTARVQGTAGDSHTWESFLAEKGTGPPAGTVPTCSLQIRSLPPTGTRGRALSIECHAWCTGNSSVGVGWLRTPVALSQYREEVAGSSSTLQLDRAQPWHQGHYQCVLQGHRSQAVSLQVTVSDDPSSAAPAIAVGTTLSLVGLMVTGAISHRLCKRFRFRYELS